MGALALLRRRRAPAAPLAPTTGLWQAVVDLVDRARSGDQNAMAILTRVGVQAREGKTQARLTASMVKRYVAEHPFGADAAPPRPVPRLALQAAPHADAFRSAGAAVIAVPQGQAALVAALANGSTIWSNPAVGEIATSCFGSDADTRLFAIGVTGAHRELDDLLAEAQGIPGERLTVLRLGHALGEARAIQAVRAGQPIARWSVAAARELGEV